MPHLQIEASQRLAEAVEIHSLLQNLVHEFCRHETIDPRSVKAYARVDQNWVMGDGAPAEFIHLTVCVLAGRAPSLLGRISDSLYEVLQSQTQTAFEVSRTLEIRQMDPATYRK